MAHHSRRLIKAVIVCIIAILAVGCGSSDNKSASGAAAEFDTQTQNEFVGEYQIYMKSPNVIYAGVPTDYDFVIKDDDNPDTQAVDNGELVEFSVVIGGIGLNENIRHGSRKTITLPAGTHKVVAQRAGGGPRVVIATLKVIPSPVEPAVATGGGGMMEPTEYEALATDCTMDTMGSMDSLSLTFTNSSSVSSTAPLGYTIHLTDTFVSGDEADLLSSSVQLAAGETVSQSFGPSDFSAAGAALYLSSVTVEVIFLGQSPQFLCNVLDT